MLEKLSGYAMAALCITVGISSAIHACGLDENKYAKPVLALCFNMSGFVKAVLAMRAPAPEAK